MEELTPEVEVEEVTVDESAEEVLEELVDGMPKVSVEAPLQLLPDYLIIDHLYREINKRWFGGAITIPVAVRVDYKKGSLGWIGTGRWRIQHPQAGWVPVLELVISAISFGSAPESILDTIHHEMVHVLCHQEKLKDVTADGAHTKVFEAACKEFGLHSVRQVDDKVRYTTTGKLEDQSEEWREWFEEMRVKYQLDNAFKLSYNVPVTSKEPKGEFTATCSDTGNKAKFTRRQVKELIQDYAAEAIELYSPWSKEGVLTFNEAELEEEFAGVLDEDY